MSFETESSSVGVAEDAERDLTPLPYSLPTNLYQSSNVCGISVRLPRWLPGLVAWSLAKTLPRRLDRAFGIFGYHRICPEQPNSSRLTCNATPEVFERQLAALLHAGYEAWPLSKVVAHHNQNIAIPRNVFVVTFDDGYENVYEHAYPILIEHRVPATIFLATAYLDSDAPFPFDLWADAGRADVDPVSWRPLRIEQCHEMLASGFVELGSHTHTHNDLSADPAAYGRDVAQSVAFLRNHFGLESPPFAFPWGITNDALQQEVRSTGICCALTTETKLVTPDVDPFAWGRYGTDFGESPAILQSQLSGWYDLARDAWRTLRR